ncbi:hypothetical protein ACFZAG_05695 [Streptomyces sp. NPDC012403]|uniref:hypothetical protein n=1 Tax=Streptomyces sp. NPDC012403 TaxID=3364831 RepID=UPI0036E04FCD
MLGLILFLLVHDSMTYGWRGAPGFFAGAYPVAFAFEAPAPRWAPSGDPRRPAHGAALAVALGGACLADVGLPRAGPGVFGPVALDPTVSRLIGTLAGPQKSDQHNEETSVLASTAMVPHLRPARPYFLSPRSFPRGKRAFPGAMRIEK